MKIWTALPLLLGTAGIAWAQMLPSPTPSLPASLSAQAPKKTLRLGVIAPLTGPSADFGVPMRNGIQLAVDEINAAGGFLGLPLELLIQDDAANPDQGLKASEALIAQKPVAVLGFCNTGVADKSLPLYQKAQIPLVIPCASGTGLTSRFPAAESYIFRTSAKDAIQSAFVVNDIVNRGWQKVAIFADSTLYGESGLKDVVAALGTHKLTPVHIARFPLGVKDLTVELKAAQAAGANVVFSYSLGPESVAIARGRKEIGWKVPQVGAWSLSFPAFVEGAKEAGEDTLMAQTFIVEQRGNERRAAFLNAYNRRFNPEGKIFAAIPAAQAYDSTYLLLYGLFGMSSNGSAASSAERSGPALKASLENLKKVYYGAVATYDRPFSAADKDAFTANMLLLGRVRSGVVTYAYPEDARRNIFAQTKR